MKKSNQLFDLRGLISLVLGLYGMLLFIAGLQDNPTTLTKAGGMPINLWMGVALLIVALLFVVWQWLDKVPKPPSGD